MSLLRRANELLPARRAGAGGDAAEARQALGWLGEPDAVRELLAEAHAVAVELGDARLAARATSRRRSR